MIYFDNAATGGFKPSAVTESVLSAIRYLSANPGRSGHKLSLAGAGLVLKAREKLAAFFHAPAPERVCFTKNCTEALNTAIFGTVKEGGHVIATCFDHNSVLRPLEELARAGKITYDVAQPSVRNQGVSAEDVEKLVRPDTCLIAVNMVSNVTGCRADISAIGRLAEGLKIPLLADGAQAAGHYPIDMQAMNIDMLAVAGHKGMYGIMGSGALLVGERANPRPLEMGGTGTDSLSLLQPEIYPERLESGTLALPAIVSMLEGALYLEKNLVPFGNALERMTAELIRKLSALPGVRLMSAPNKAGIVAFSIDNLPSQEAADILAERYDICVRGGLHCAPLAHKFLGTDDGGLVRVSLSPHNTMREADRLVAAVAEITP